MESRPVLPVIIFPDNNHLHPLLFSLLEKLAPKIKSLGYAHFYDEMSSDHTVESQLNALDQAIAESEKKITALSASSRFSA